jgi:hypothetical protein
MRACMRPGGSHNIAVASNVGAGAAAWQMQRG